MKCNKWNVKLNVQRPGCNQGGKEGRMEGKNIRDCRWVRWVVRSCAYRERRKKDERGDGRAGRKDRRTDGRTKRRRDRKKEGQKEGRKEDGRTDGRMEGRKKIKE
jgi:hypothetical protein